MNEKAQVCESREEAMSLFENCPFSVHRLQRFIKPNSNHISKLRVHWKVNKVPKLYRITKKKPVEQYSSFPTHKQPVHIKSRSIQINHTYTQKILPTSISVNLPFSNTNTLTQLKQKFRSSSNKALNKSSMGCSTQDITQTGSPARSSESKFRNSLKYQPFIHIIAESNPKIREERSKELNDKFLVHYSNLNECNIVSSSQQIPEVTKTIQHVADIISLSFHKKSISIQELVVDFMKDMNGNYIFLACKGLKFQGARKSDRYNICKDTAFREKSEHIIEDGEFNPEEVLEQYDDSMTKEYDFVSQGTRFTSTDQEDKKIQLMRLLEEQANRMNTRPAYIDQKLIQQNSIEAYLKFKNVDELGRTPFKMIGMTPYPNKSKLITFYEHSKKQPIKPTRHRDRLKNVSWTDGCSDNRSLVNMTYNQLDTIAKQYDFRVKSAIKGKEEIHKKMILWNFLADQRDKWNRVSGLLTELVAENHKLISHFEAKQRDDIEKIFKNGVVGCIHPGKGVGLRSRIRKVHSSLKISHSDYEEFLKALRDSLSTLFTDEEAIELIVDRVRSFESDIVSCEENPRQNAKRFSIMNKAD
jgi:truncated hemoglobin YjbI